MPVGRARARPAPSRDRRGLPRRVALIASAGPEHELPGSIREVEQIDIGLKRHWGDQVSVDVFMSGTDRRPTGRRFREVLMSGDYDIIHYAGHAVFESDRQDQSGLMLEKGEVCFAQKIQRLLEGSPLVFLNACESARLKEERDRQPPEGSYDGDPKKGLASAFVYGGALACIGTMWPVTDTEAADFAVAFYGHVLEGQSLGEAMRRARTMTAESHPEDPSWASFVLYGDPTYSLGTRRGSPP
jgi:CHAT domain-containing protein